jgi:hypothetical protein
MKIAIFGLDHIGSWLAKDLSCDHSVGGYDGSSVICGRTSVAILDRPLRTDHR